VLDLVVALYFDEEVRGRIESDQLQNLSNGEGVFGRQLRFSVHKKLGGVAVSSWLGFTLLIDLRIIPAHVPIPFSSNEECSNILTK